MRWCCFCFVLFCFTKYSSSGTVFTQLLISSLAPGMVFNKDLLFAEGRPRKVNAISREFWHSFYSLRMSKSIPSKLWGIDSVRLYGDKNDDYPLSCILHCRFHDLSLMFANDIWSWQPDDVPRSDENTLGYVPFPNQVSHMSFRN